MGLYFTSQVVRLAFSTSPLVENNDKLHRRLSPRAPCVHTIHMAFHSALGAASTIRTSEHSSLGAT